MKTKDPLLAQKDGTNAVKKPSELGKNNPRSMSWREAAICSANCGPHYGQSNLVRGKDGFNSIYDCYGHPPTYGPMPGSSKSFLR